MYIKRKQPTCRNDQNWSPCLIKSKRTYRKQWTLDNKTQSLTNIFQDLKKKKKKKIGEGTWKLFEHQLKAMFEVLFTVILRVWNLKFTRNLKFATSKTLVNFMKKMMFLSKNWYFSVQKAIIYYTFNKSHHISFILLVFSHVANFRYVANFRFLTLGEC